MSPTWEDWKLLTEAGALAREAEAPSRFNLVQAFNLGRAVGRIEHARDAFGLRVRWLLWGAGAGLTLAAVYLHIFLSEGILQKAK